MDLRYLILVSRKYMPFITQSMCIYNYLLSFFRLTEGANRAVAISVVNKAKSMFPHINISDDLWLSKW